MAATFKIPKQIRSWNNCDSFENSDVERLFDTENVKITKPAKCVRYWSVYVTLFGVFAVFLVCIVIGFYFRDDQNVTRYCSGDGRRGDSLENDKLQAVHNNIVYHVSGDRIIQYIRDVNHLKSSTPFFEWDNTAAQLVEREFRDFGFDQVQVEEEEVRVHSPDNPNRLEVVFPDGSIFLNVSINRGNNTGHNQPESPPFVAFSASAIAQGPLVYVGAGRHVDFRKLQVQGVILPGAIALMHLDNTPVAEKVHAAEQFGCVGVLLFCNHDNTSCSHDNQTAPYASAAGRGYTPSIPVQTVSMELGSRLLQNITHNSSPSASNLTARLTVNNTKLQTDRVYTIIGTIQGDLEPDRHILIGSGRQTWSPVVQDPVVTTSMMMEMARSFTQIQRLTGWRPRRSLKFVSWGGHHLSQAGLLQYFNAQKKSGEETVSYLELNAGWTGSDVIKIDTSPALIRLAKIAKAMVPNPANPDISLDVFSPSLSQEAVYQSESGLVTTYSVTSPNYHVLLDYGVPTVSIGAKHTNISKEAQQDYTRDITHHYKYHVSQCRVASHMILSLVDSPLLPFDVNQYIEHIKQLIQQTVSVIQQQQGFHCDATRTLKEWIQQIRDPASQPSQTQLTVSCDKLREINNRLIRLDSLFITSPTNQKPAAVGHSANRSSGYKDSVLTSRVSLTKLNDNIEPDESVYILTENEQNGGLQFVTDVLDVYSVTHHQQPVCDTLDWLLATVDELIQKLDTVYS